MDLLHRRIMETEYKDQCELIFPPQFLEKQPLDVFNKFRKFVEVPDGLSCPDCYNYHGYPSRELSVNECMDFIFFLERCPNYNYASIEYPRRYFFGPE